MSSTRGRQVVVLLTNKSGGSVAAGDVVVLDSSNDTAFTTTTTSRAEVHIGIAQETIANNATGRVLVNGYAALVNVPASVTRGHYVQTHTVAKQATGNSTRQSGSFGTFLTGGTTPTALIWGDADQTASGGGGLTQAYAGYNTVGGSTEAMVDLRMYCKSFTLANDCQVTDIEAYMIQASDHVFALSVALFANNAGVVGDLLNHVMHPRDTLVLESSSTPTYNAGWYGIPIGKWLTAGTYWAGVLMDVNAGTMNIYYDGSGSDRTIALGSYWIASGGRYTQTDSTKKYSIRVNTIR